jgi:hypothetical protein
MTCGIEEIGGVEDVSPGAVGAVTPCVAVRERASLHA